MSIAFKFVCYAVFALCLTGCQNVAETPMSDASAETSVPITAELSPRERDIVEKMKWVETANATRDAEEALASGKPQLITFSSRELNIPGLTMNQYDRIKSKTDYKMAENGGDVIYGDVHLALRRKLNVYAKAYNQAIYAALSTQ